MERKANDGLNDLGFGSRVSAESRLRLLNRDGSFNVSRSGLSFFQSLHFYRSLLEMSWWRFYLIIGVAYILINLAFAATYVALGISIDGSLAATPADKFWDAFFFSVQTFTTVGYGHLTPKGFAANVVASFDAFVGLICFALATGLLFARFSRPTVKILFSLNALIAPYKDGTALMFRLANARSNQLIDVEVKVLYTEVSGSGAKRRRQFRLLKLEREKVVFLPLHLTVVHAIDRQSPLHGKDAQALEHADSEFLVLITAFDETFSQTVHARSSYKWEEIVWHAKFTDMFKYDSEGLIRVDLKEIHSYESVNNVDVSRK